MAPDPLTVYLVDGSAYIHRAFHAISGLATKDGLPTNAVFGFTNTLLRVIRDQGAEHLAVAFDAKGPTFRHRIYEAYKANRPAMDEALAVQMPYVRKVVAGYRIPSLEEEGVEADDLIASAAHRLAAAGCRVVVVSGDKDLLQLVTGDVRLWDPMSDRWYDEPAVEARYGVAPARLLDYFALVGDSSDNIPGVAGVGPKTAAKLIAAYGDLEGIYAHLDELRGAVAKRIAAGREAAFLSRELIRLRTDCPVPATVEAYRMGPPDQEELRALFRELEFGRLLKENLGPETMASAGFQLVQDEAVLASLAGRWQQNDLLAVDVETSGLDTLTADLVGVTIAVNGEEAWYLPVGHRDEDGALLPGQLAPAAVIAALEPILEDTTIAKVGHNLKFDYAVLRNHGITLGGPLYDTMIASYVLDPVRRSHKLDTLCAEELELRLTSFAEAVGGDRRPDAFVRVPLARAATYAGEDAAAAWLLWQRFRPRLEEAGQWRLFQEVEMPLVPILAEMEARGVLVDREVLRRLSDEFSRQITELETRIHRLAGMEFNVNSPRQLGEILFDRLGLPHGRKTKTGYSTDARVLEKLARIHELPAAVLAHRTLAKLKSTYVDGLLAQIHPKSGRVHTSFNQAVTATGRLSSSDPNLQNIPVRTEEGRRIRSAFIAAPGHLFVSADYSQIDLRVLAHYSQDPALLAAFRAGDDIHRRTAAEIFQVSPLLVTKEMRRVAKTINFGIVYGMSAHGLAEQLGISRKEAAAFIDRFFAVYPGVQRYMAATVAQAREHGYVTTLLGRRRNLPEIASRNKMRREFAERTAINTPIQGTAADIIKLATIAAHRHLAAASSGAWLVLQIHDELVFEVAAEEAETLAAAVKPVMEGVLDLAVPLVVNVSTGPNLAAV